MLVKLLLALLLIDSATHLSCVCNEITLSLGFYTGEFWLLGGQFELYNNYTTTSSNKITNIYFDVCEIDQYEIVTQNVTLDTSNDGYCYTIVMALGASGNLLNNYQWDRPYYYLSLYNQLLNIQGQSISYGEFTPSTRTYFCTNMFDDSNNNNNVLTIEMETYPTDLILSISRVYDYYYGNYEDSTEELLYQTTFEDTSFTWSNNYNQSLMFSNLYDGCYSITFYDELFDVFDSSINHPYSRQGNHS